MSNQDEELNRSLALARHCVSSNLLERGAKAARRVLSIEPDLSEGHAILAICMAALGDKEQARPEADTALVLNAEDYYSYYASATVAQVAADWERAATDIRNAIELRPDIAYLHRELANIHLVRGEQGAAVSAAQRAVELAPDDAESHFLLAEIYFVRKEMAEADAYLQEVLRLDPENAGAHKLLGIRTLQKEQLEAGVAHIKESLRLNPNDSLAQWTDHTLELVQKPFFQLFLHFAAAEDEVTRPNATQSVWSSWLCILLLVGFVAVSTRAFGISTPLVMWGSYILFTTGCGIGIYFCIAAEMLAQRHMYASNRVHCRVARYCGVMIFALLPRAYWLIPIP